MATIRKRGMRWQVQVRRSNGYRASRSFLLRADADRWAREAEAEADRRFLQTDPSQLAKLRLADLLKRYEASVTPAKRSAATERQFLAALLARPLAQLRLCDLTPRRLADYRDERLSRVRPASVLRELALLQHVLEVARREWGVGLSDNPCRMVAKPFRERPKRARCGGDVGPPRSPDALPLHPPAPGGHRPQAGRLDVCNTRRVRSLGPLKYIAPIANLDV